MDDVITLLTVEVTEDEHANQVETVTGERQVFCTVDTVTRSEFYQAAQNDLHPELVVTLSHFMDYRGEKLFRHTDWTGAERTYEVLRTYRPKGTDALEITAQERIRDYGRG